MQNQETTETYEEGLENPQEFTEEEEIFEEEIEESSPKVFLKKFVAHFKKGREEDALIVNHMMNELNDSAIGEIPFEDVIVYLFENKLEESDYAEIRSMAFERKVDEARRKYNKENKTDLTRQDFLATTLNAYLQ